jgi:ferric-dicitrate binding protein FerR (iron transport regulator)
MKDEKHPFVVSTEYVDVQALGTRFDVCAYPEDQDVYTTLDEGSVRILNKAVNISMTLVPGEQNVCRTPNGEMENRKVRTDLYTSWKDELLRFDNALFDEVVKKMERWYGVKIVVDKRLKYSENYTFTIKTESLRELLGLLSYTTPMTFKIDKDSVMIYPLYHKK